MYQLKKFSCLASGIALDLKKTLIGKDIIINNICNLENAQNGSMILCYPKNRSKLLGITSNCLIFCTKDTIVENDNLSYLVSSNPKYTFFHYINEYLSNETTYWHSDVIHSKSDNYPEVTFGENVKIGKNAIIAPGTKIGSNTIVGNNVVIRLNVEIGSCCIIKDNTVIGSEGFGFMSSPCGLEHIRQIGGIKIGDKVTIGSNCTIEKPALGKTTICNNVKIDDLVQIGHNVEIGDSTIITTGFKSEGGVKIGSGSFIGIGVTIISKKANIGNNCLIGAGTVITNSIPDNKIAYNSTKIILNDINDKLQNILKTPISK